jgi:hypothetical protein
MSVYQLMETGFAGDGFATVCVLLYYCPCVSNLENRKYNEDLSGMNPQILVISSQPARRGKMFVGVNYLVFLIIFIVGGGGIIQLRYQECSNKPNV